MDGFDAGMAAGLCGIAYFGDLQTLTVVPYEMGAMTGVLAKVWHYKNLVDNRFDVEGVVSRQYPYGDGRTELTAVSSLRWLSDETRLHTTAGLGDAFSVSLYNYSLGRVVSVERYGQGWNGSTTYDFVWADGGELLEITSGNYKVWKRA